MTTSSRRLAGIALAVATLAGCANDSSAEQNLPQNVPTTTVNPMGGPNSFSPSIKAPGPKTALPGNVVTGG